MILYIHGFASSASGFKAEIMKENFKDEGIVLPSLSNIPSLAIDTLEQIVEYALKKGDRVDLVGSSLGAYYSLYLANKYKLKAVLINPAVNPALTLGDKKEQKSYYDGSYFQVTKEHMEFIKTLEVNEFYDEKELLILTQTDDEVLDYKEALEKYKNTQKIVVEGGNHSFEGFENYLETISDFFKGKKI